MGKKIEEEKLIRKIILILSWGNQFRSDTCKPTNNQLRALKIEVEESRVNYTFSLKTCSLF